MGAGNLNHRELHQLIKRRTGGMSLSTHVTTHHSDVNAFEQVGWGQENDSYGLEGRGLGSVKPNACVNLYNVHALTLRFVNDILKCGHSTKRP